MDKQFILNFISNLISGFIANYYATLIAGTTIGVIGGYLISKKLNLDENRKEKIRRKGEETLRIANEGIIETKKRIMILELVEDEVVTNLDTLKRYVGKDKIDDDEGYPIFQTDYWELLKTSGEIPKLFSSNIIIELSSIYFIMNLLNKHVERMLRLSDNSTIPPKLFTKFFKMINDINEFDKKDSISKVFHKELLFHKSVLRKFKKIRKETEFFLSDKVLI
jgi:hypothetical protein